MISRDELLAQAAEHQLNESDVQRDYVFGWLISGVFRASNLGDALTLKGGNALRKGYFPGTRFSDDLDFTTADGVDGNAVLAQLNEVCRYVENAAGVRFDIGNNRIEGEQQIDHTKRVYKIRLYFKDFITGQDHVTLKVRVDLTEYDRLYLPVQTRQLIHPYSDADACSTTIRCVKLEEALADKLKCLLQRRYCYDLFDLAYGAFVARDIEVNRAEILQVFLRKTIFGDNPGAAKSLLLDLPLDLFKGYWTKVLCPAASRMSFDRAVQTLRAGIEDLFAPYGYAGHAANAFFPSAYRNPILQAGSGKKLMRLRYHGYTRIVEPYSLAYKRRRTDNVAQEYFYAYDRTGGSKGPGIKAFLHHDIEQLEILDETFEPRFAIELGKAGDSALSGYFRGSSTWGSGAVSARRRRATGPVYVVQCTYCAKQFRRTSGSTTMNKHKDRYGNQCYGRSGFIVQYG